MTAGAVGNQTIEVSLTTPDGKQLATGMNWPGWEIDKNQSYVTVWDLATQTKRPPPFLGVPVLSLAYRADGRSLAIGCSDKTLRVWDLSAEFALQPLNAHGPREAWGIAFARDGSMFATGGALRGAVARRLLAHDAVPEAAAGTRIGAFEIREPIGRGGMGAVFRAERVEGGFEQTVAIKRMSATDATTRERFRAEMEILARLAHPNIAQLVDGGVCADGSLYLAMEYVDEIGRAHV